MKIEDKSQEEDEEEVEEKEQNQEEPVQTTLSSEKQQDARDTHRWTQSGARQRSTLLCVLVCACDFPHLVLHVLCDNYVKWIINLGSRDRVTSVYDITLWQTDKSTLVQEDKASVCVSFFLMFAI